MFFICKKATITFIILYSINSVHIWKKIMIEYIVIKYSNKFFFNNNNSYQNKLIDAFMKPKSVEDEEP